MCSYIFKERIHFFYPLISSKEHTVFHIQISWWLDIVGKILSSYEKGFEIGRKLASDFLK